MEEIKDLATGGVGGSAVREAAPVVVAQASVVLFALGVSSRVVARPTP